MLSRIKPYIPAILLDWYHHVLAILANAYYRSPSKQLIVIGVTGTNGKTTSSYFIAKALEGAGLTTGCTTTALIKIGDKELQNRFKMTMPGRFALQRLLREMVDAGCTHVVIETSSQGLIQHRHVGIAYDIAVFTNLTPEHLEAHGGFEAYKRAKGILFDHLAKQPAKYVQGKPVPKAIILNADSEHASFYQREGIHTRWYGINSTQGLYPESIVDQGKGTRFNVNGVEVTLAIPGQYNVANALAALSVGQVLGCSLDALAKGLARITQVPGRFQFIQEGQPFDVIIDYAYEPEAMKAFYHEVQKRGYKRIIHVVGSCGGGRDKGRRPVLGALAVENADIVIITNEDPYDDNPEEIVQEVAAGALQAGGKLNETVYCIQDRKQAIFFAIEQAKPDDVVLLTGKGNESWICIAHEQKIPWNEEGVAREALQSVLSRV